MSEAMTWAFTGGVVGGFAVSMWHQWHHDRMAARFHDESMRLIANHHQVVTGLIERLNDAPRT